MKLILGAIVPLLFSNIGFGEVKPDLDKGRRLYFSNCISCHNKDPNIKGSLGPEQVDTPYDVFTHKVVTGRYPEKLPLGYLPKRKTKVMRKFPNLEKDIIHIYSWIQSQKKKKEAR
jgi:mono/diheme cytochrome c family protein